MANDIPDLSALTALFEGKLSKDEELALAQRALEWAIPKAQLALAAIKTWRSYGPEGPFAPAATGIQGDGPRVGRG